MQQLETQAVPMTRDEYRRRARILWNVAQIAMERARTAEAAFVEERTLRQNAEDRSAMLAERVQQLEALHDNL